MYQVLRPANCRRPGERHAPPAWLASVARSRRDRVEIGGVCRPESGIAGPGQVLYRKRRLPAVLAEAGYTSLDFVRRASTGYGPVAPELKRFLEAYLTRLGDRVGPMLDESLRRQLDGAVDGDGDDLLLRAAFHDELAQRAGLGAAG